MRKILIIRCIVYLLVFAADLALYLFLHSHFLMISLVLLVVLPVASIYSASCIRKTVTVRLLSMERAVAKDETAHIEILLEHHAVGVSLDCRIRGTLQNRFFGTGGDFEASMPLSFRRRTTLKLPLRSDYCGLVQLSLSSVDFQDMLGLVRFELPLNLQAGCVFLPDEELPEKTDLTGFASGISESQETQTRGYDFAEVTDIREYHPGDRLKDIHWKISAKKDLLMVKQRENIAQSQVIMVIDMTGDRQEVQEICSFARGLCNRLVQDAMPVRLMWWLPQAYRFEEAYVFDEESGIRAFIKLLGEPGASGVDLPAMMRHCHPMVPAFVLIHRKRGEAVGEVVFHG